MILSTINITKSHPKDILNELNLLHFWRKLWRVVNENTFLLPLNKGPISSFKIGNKIHLWLGVFLKVLKKEREHRKVNYQHNEKTTTGWENIHQYILMFIKYILYSKVIAKIMSKSSLSPMYSFRSFIVNSLTFTS